MNPVLRPRFAVTVVVFARVALALGYLSAVADRIGLWGRPGEPGVAWGAWAPFVAYTAQLNAYAPAPLVPLLAGVATLAEISIALALLVGWRLRAAATASAALAATFALAMTSALGVKAPLDFSVFTVVAASLLLAVHPPRMPQERTAADARTGAGAIDPPERGRPGARPAGAQRPEVHPCH